TAHVNAGDELTFTIEARFLEATDNPVAGIWINSANGVVYNESIVGALPSRVEAGQVVSCDIRLRAALASGSYQAKAILRASYRHDAAIARARPVNFFVSGRKNVGGSADLGATFAMRVSDGSGIQPAEDAAADSGP
ncbi:MAG: Wzt carbohydrate-binding domain-containing protein, partial [Actinomycetota bacterium]